MAETRAKRRRSKHQLPLDLSSLVPGDILRIMSDFSEVTMEIMVPGPNPVCAMIYTMHAYGNDVSRSQTDMSVIGTLLGSVPYAFGEDGDLIPKFYNGILMPTAGNVVIIHGCSEVLQAGIDECTVTRDKRVFYHFK